MGTIEYGAEHLHAPLIVALGHQDYGAVAADCDVAKNHTKLPGSMAPMVEAIVPADRAVMGKPGNFVDNAVRESARRTAMKIGHQSHIVEELMHVRKVKVIYGRYSLDTGEVEFLGWPSVHRCPATTRTLPLPPQQTPHRSNHQADHPKPPRRQHDRRPGRNIHVIRRHQPADR